MKQSKLNQALQSVGSATIGQGLNFIAMLLPVFLQRGDQLAYLLVPLSIAIVAHKVGFLCFHVKYLAVSRDEEAIATATSFLGLVATTAIVFACSAALLPWSSYWAVVGFSAGLLVFSHGLYFMAVTILIAENKLAEYGTGRLLYGVVNIILTSLVVCLLPSRGGLVLAALALTLLVGLWMLSKADNKILGFVASHYRRAVGAEGRAFARSCVPLVGSTFVAEMGFQINGFFTPLMGQLQELWAIVVRVTGGFATVGSQVLAPVFETKVSEALRASNLSDAHMWVKRSQMAGLVFAAATGLFQCGILYYFYGSEFGWVILASGGIYAAAFLSSTVPGKMPFLMQRDKIIFVWSVIRVAFHIPLFALAEGRLLVALAAVQFLFAVWLIFITLMPPKSSASLVEQPETVPLGDSPYSDAEETGDAELRKDLASSFAVDEEDTAEQIRRGQNVSQVVWTKEFPPLIVIEGAGS